MNHFLTVSFIPFEALVTSWKLVRDLLLLMGSSHWARDSLAGRLSLYFGTGTLLILGLLGSILFVMFERQLLLHDSNEIANKAAAVQTLLNGINQPTDIKELVNRIRATEVAHKDLDVGVLIDGIWVLEPGESIVSHAERSGVSPDKGIGDTVLIDIGEERWAMYFLAHRMTDQPRSVVRAIVAIDISATTRLVARLRNTLITIGLVGAAMITVLTWVATVRTLAPLKRVAQEAERMTAQSLDRSLSVENAPIEVRGLVVSINQMLSRLQKSFGSIEQFSAAIAHELRTPVNALLTQTQVTLSRDRTIDEYRETLHLGLEKLNRLQRMVVDILFIARTDQSIDTTPFELIDLTKTATEVVEYVELIASENDQTIAIEGELTIPGDPLMLRRALSNLLTNAVHHAPHKAHILLTLSAEPGYAVVRVTNPYDESLSQADVEQLFERLTRQSPDQAGQQGRLELGFSIVQSIMRVHGGRATAGLEGDQFWVQLRWPII